MTPTLMWCLCDVHMVLTWKLGTHMGTNILVDMQMHVPMAGNIMNVCPHVGTLNVPKHVFASCTLPSSLETFNVPTLEQHIPMFMNL